MASLLKQLYNSSASRKRGKKDSKRKRRRNSVIPVFAEIRYKNFINYIINKTSR
jgi:hypothetical protein